MGVDMSTDSQSSQLINPDILISNHQGLVVSVAQSIYRRVPRHIPFEDILSYGQVGLVQAARSYRPVPDSEFSTYAYYRISGSIYEGLARMNWTSRAEYRRLKAQEAANEVLREEAMKSSRTGRSDPNESAAWLDSTVAQLSAVFLMSQFAAGEGHAVEPLDHEVAPWQKVADDELREAVRRALTDLPPEGERLIKLVYFDDHSLAKAAKLMGKSRSWASRFHHMILRKLAKALSGVDE